MFISKKQKQLMRERRKKKRKSHRTETCEDDQSTREKGDTVGEKNVSEIDTLEDCNQVSQSSQASSSQESSSESTKPTNVDDADMGGTNLLASAEDSPPGKRIVYIKPNMNVKEAKKFRKDVRRQSRRDGLNDELIIFLEEGQKLESEADRETKSLVGKKRKREFPKINQLLEEEKKKAEKRAKKEAQNKSEMLLSDEAKNRYRAVDCEMVGIGTKGRISALARVSVTDWSGSVLLDTFVKVPSKVTDFRTQWSGVSARHLKSNSAIEAEECRAQVAALLKGKVLVGHALKNDLDALMLSHPRHDIRDTAKYRPFQRLNGTKWRPRKLRDLVKEHCDLDIQKAGESHDSVDDARAAMEVFKVARQVWEAELERKSKTKAS